MDRNKLEQFIWERKHEDYRSLMGGQRSVLMNGGAVGTVLAPLSSLTEEELVREAKVLGWKGAE